MSQTTLKQYIRLLADYLKPQQRRVIWLAITLLSSIALQLINPQILRYFIDTATAGNPNSALLMAALLFIGIALLTQAFTLATTYFGETVAWTATNTLRADLTTHCLSLDLAFHKACTPGELVERVDGDVTTLSNFFSRFALYLLGNGLLLVGILAALWVEDWRAGLGLTLFALGALGCLGRLHRIATPAWRQYRQLSGEFFGFLGEYLAGKEDLRANGALSYVKHRFQALLQRWLPIFHRARLTQTILWGSSVALFALGNAIALGVGTYLWRRQAITIGTVYLIFYYTNLLRQPITSIREELADFQQAQASILRVHDLLKTSSRLPPAGDRPLPSGALSVAFEQVWFSYEAGEYEGVMASESAGVTLSSLGSSSRLRQPAIPRSPSTYTLQDISFHLPAGQLLGVIGRTGSGKTTLTRLLLRFYAAQSGVIRLGSVPIETVAIASLRRRVGMVTQDVQLFQATIRDNVSLFDPTIGDHQIQQALGEVGLLPWLNAHPHGLDTRLDSDSGGLSAGEAQLLAFARIWLRQPGLVILDEASSRLDPMTERCIEQAIAKLLQHRTGIIIAHRLQTLQSCDRILLLEQGRIVEYGDRHHLAADPPSRFAQLLKTGLPEP